MQLMRTVLALLVLCFAAAMSARADEGMWTVDNFPADRVEKAYGFRPTQEWLDKVRLSAVRLAGGCSASFVSPRGLVQTNHHCASRCIENLSRKGTDYLKLGFYAKEAKDEVACPGVEVNQLTAISDTTLRVKAALDGKDGAELTAAKKAVEADITRECAGGDGLVRCDIVELYRGGVYNLYKYRRYQDVRLVFAPEQAIAFFGGDPDNFEFPRYDLDVTYLRVYADGAPIDTAANYFKYAKSDVASGDLVFTAGHPGSTRRQNTVAELEFARDVNLPRGLFHDSELRGLVTEFSTKGEEQARIATGLLFGLENSLKGTKGRFEALVASDIIKRRTESERELRAKVDADPDLNAKYGDAWDRVKSVLAYWRPRRDAFAFIQGRQGLSSRLFGHALTLARYPVELAKHDGTRLPGFTEAGLPSLRQSIGAKAPIYPELEKLTLAFSLTKLREVLGPDHAFVKKVLAAKSPSQVARELIDGTRLGDEAFRTRLMNGEIPENERNADTMLSFALHLDEDLRLSRSEFEDNVSTPLIKEESRIAAARFAVYGTSEYPDATFSLRVSFGSVRGYEQNATTIEPITRFAGLFERATGADPYKLPEKWLAAKSALDPDQAMNFVSTNDIIGGNSGSPVINRHAEIVGLIFDGNAQSLGGDYGYNAPDNRAVSVSVGAMRAALRTVYGADRIVAELNE